MTGEGDGYIRFAVWSHWRGLLRYVFCYIFFHRKNLVLGHLVFDVLVPARFLIYIMPSTNNPTDMSVFSSPWHGKTQTLRNAFSHILIMGNAWMCRDETSILAFWDSKSKNVKRIYPFPIIWVQQKCETDISVSDHLGPVKAQKCETDISVFRRLGPGKSRNVKRIYPFSVI